MLLLLIVLCRHSNQTGNAVSPQDQISSGGKPATGASSQALVTKDVVAADIEAEREMAKAARNADRFDLLKSVVAPAMLQNVQDDLAKGKSDQSTLKMVSVSAAAMSALETTEASNQIKALEEHKAQVENTLAAERAKPDSPYIQELENTNYELDQSISDLKSRQKKADANFAATSSMAEQTGSQDQALASASQVAAKADKIEAKIANATGSLAADQASTSQASTRQEPTESALAAVGSGSEVKQGVTPAMLRASLRTALASRLGKGADKGAGSKPGDSALPSAAGSDVTNHAVDESAAGKYGAGQSAGYVGGQASSAPIGVRLSGADSDKSVTDILHNFMGDNAKEAGRGLASDGSSSEGDLRRQGILASTSSDLFGRVTAAIDKLAPVRGLLR